MVKLEHRLRWEREQGRKRPHSWFFGRVTPNAGRAKELLRPMSVAPSQVPPQARPIAWETSSMTIGLRMLEVKQVLVRCRIACRWHRKAETCKATPISLHLPACPRGVTKLYTAGGFKDSTYSVSWSVAERSSDSPGSRRRLMSGAGVVLPGTLLLLSHSAPTVTRGIAPDVVPQGMVLFHGGLSVCISVAAPPLGVVVLLQGTFPASTLAVLACQLVGTWCWVTGFGVISSCSQGLD